MHPFDNRDEQNRDGAHLLLIFQSNRILLKSYLSLVHCARMARLHFLSCGLIYAYGASPNGVLLVQVADVPCVTVDLDDFPPSSERKYGRVDSSL